MYQSFDGKTTVKDEDATMYMFKHTTERERLEMLKEWYFSGNWLHCETCARCGNVGSETINGICPTCRKELNSWDEYILIMPKNGTK